MGTLSESVVLPSDGPSLLTGGYERDFLLSSVQEAPGASTTSFLVRRGGWGGAGGRVVVVVVAVAVVVVEW